MSMTMAEKTIDMTIVANQCGMSSSLKTLR